MMTSPQTLNEWDLPSDADMLRWLEAKQASLLCVPYGDWQVVVGDPEGKNVIRSVTLGRGKTVHAALEAAMKERP